PHGHDPVTALQLLEDGVAEADLGVVAALHGRQVSTAQGLVERADQRDVTIVHTAIESWPGRCPSTQPATSPPLGRAGRARAAGGRTDGESSGSHCRAPPSPPARVHAPPGGGVAGTARAARWSR